MTSAADRAERLVNRGEISPQIPFGPDLDDVRAGRPMEHRDRPLRLVSARSAAGTAVRLYRYRAFPRKRLVKSCTRRLRGNAGQQRPGAPTSASSSRATACGPGRRGPVAHLPERAHPADQQPQVPNGGSATSLVRMLAPEREMSAHGEKTATAAGCGKP